MSWTRSRSATESNPSKVVQNEADSVITLENGNEIRIDFYSEDAPKTVENFVTLRRRAFTTA